MKGRAIAFLLIFALICGAFGFMSADLSASAKDYALEGELLAGSREAAEGIALEYAQWLHGCLVWRTAYDLGSGGQTLDFSWWPSLEEPETRPFELEAEGLLARAVCHELAHLDGQLYVELVEGELMDVESEEESGEE